MKRARVRKEDSKIIFQEMLDRQTIIIVYEAYLNAYSATTGLQESL